MEKVTEKNVSINEALAEEKKEHIVVADFKMVTFSLAGKDYAIDIMKVKEIAKANRFTYVPNTSPFVLGVYNLRGDIIPIIDLRLFFNIEVPEQKSDDLENLIIVTVEDQTFGIVVDIIEKVVAIHSSTIQPPHPLFGDINIKYIYGVVESNNRLYILLDVDRIFGSKIHQEQTTENIRGASKTVGIDLTEHKTKTGAKKVAPKDDDTDIDYTFVLDSLKQLKKFTVTSINEQWVQSRFLSWKKERGSDNVQFVDEKDADAFLDSFYSVCSEKFWQEKYAKTIYKALPETSAKQINVWNPGCGKGYEAYSLACLMKKRYPDARIRIYAHDIDLLCVSNAPLLTVPPEYVNSWYKEYLTKTVSGEYTFSPEIKDSILFEYHDCLHTNSMPDVDLIFCRDVISFFDEKSQETILNEFDEKLKGNGVLILGDNELLTSSMRWSEKMVDSVTVYSKQ
ncbi:MAG: chemotaxis protein CheW [Treponema sp.]|jgi:purine-binding chemotaxis protein CheW|nr:chemotaxis protein CheW [Treponema sp.]